jgi:co-chaperonin GroES (HSP10)
MEKQQSSILKPNNKLVGVKSSKTGLVMAMGPQCYKDKERYPEGPWCKEKDWVMFARYAGSRIKIEGGEMRLLNDDEVLATIDSPEDILHEF